MRKIIEVQFVAPRPEEGKFTAQVIATFNDKLEKLLFYYYSDELHFTAKELIGLTEQEACNLKFKKDKYFLTH